MSYGRRDVRAYPITEGELYELAEIGVLAGICFTIAGAAFGFAVDVHRDLEFASGLPEKVTAFWRAMRIVGFGFALILAIAGGLFVWRGRSRLRAIKQSAKFDESKNETTV